MGRVLWCPPVREFAFGIKFRAGVVEAMADLVPDGSADRAVVGRSVRLRIEEGRLQNGSGKVESVLEWEIKRVDCLRSHPPFVAVNRTTQLGELMMVFPFRRSPGIPERIVTPNNEPGIIAPFLRITDANAQGLELGFGLRFCRRRHPRQRVDAMVEPGKKIFNHLLYRSLGRRREILRDVNFDKSVTEIGVDI